MPSNDQFPDTPSQPNASLLLDQRAANERLLLAALSAQEDAEQAHSGRLVAEDESDLLRVKTAELVAAAEFRERLLGIIGHDLRNPLNTMLVAAQLLAKRSQLPAEDAWLARRIVDSGQRMARMIEQLTSFTRARHDGGFELDLRPCDLGVICRSVVEELRLSSGTEILLTTTGALEGTWDADRLAEVLSNVIGNATGHATSGTPVTVVAHEQGSGVVIEIGNEGESIPPELLETIFSAFGRGQTNSRRESGHLGLGLYISSQILLSHGGTINVQSSAGSTTFSIDLPRLSRD